MEKGKQFQDPALGITSSYSAPRFSRSGSMLSGHMVVAKNVHGEPLGFIEWGHKTTPNGKAVVIGRHDDTQEHVDNVFSHLWKNALEYATSTNSSHQVSRSEGLSHYEAPSFYGANGNLI